MALNENVGSSSQTAEAELQEKRRGGRRPGAGRQRIQFDLQQVEQLYKLGCTNAEVAAVFMCSVRTIETRSKKAPFGSIKARGQATLQISLRRWQLKLAEKGNVVMLLWLAKNFLGQRDQPPFPFDPQRRALTSLELEQADQSTQLSDGIWMSEEEARY